MSARSARERSPAIATPIERAPRSSSTVAVVIAVAVAAVAVVAVLALALRSGHEEGSEPPAIAALEVAAQVEPPPPIDPALTLEPEGPPVAPEIQSIDDLPALHGVPALALRPVSDKAAKRGRDHFYDGDERREAGDLPGAIAAYVEGLKDDPGNIATRYNLACAYVLAEEPAKAMALLREFKDNGCNFCLDRLIRARDDNDWRALFGHPVFEELTSDITVEVVGFEQAARELIKAVTETGDPSAVERLFHPRRAVTLAIEHQGCEPGGELKCSEREKLRGTAVLSRWVRETYEDHQERDPQVVVGRLIECREDGEDAGCCEFDSVGGQQNAYFVDEVCFAVTSGTAPYLKSIAVRDEP